MALRIRRGTDAERQSITPKLGELLYVTDTGLIYVGDGTTQGGSLVSANLENDESPTLSANLDLNGNDIVGTGNINIDGNITATGNINIGDGVEDNVIVGGTISSDLIPTTDTAFDLGSETFRWQNAHLTGLFVDGNISAESITVNTMFKDDSGVLYDALTDTLTVSSIDGDLIGSVFSEDSTVLINATDSSLNTSFLKIVDSNITVENEFEQFTVFTTQGFNVFTDQGVSIRANQIDGGLFSNLLLLESGKTVNDSLISPDPGDTIGGFGTSIFDDSIDDYAGKSLILTKLENSDSGSVLEFLVADDQGDLKSVFTLNGKGVAESSLFKTGSYADETERDTNIPNPEPGMIIFLAGHDDSTGSPKFQGYDGTAWRDFN